MVSEVDRPLWFGQPDSIHLIVELQTRWIIDDGDVEDRLAALGYGHWNSYSAYYLSSLFLFLCHDSSDSWTAKRSVRGINNTRSYPTGWQPKKVYIQGFDTLGVLVWNLDPWLPLGNPLIRWSVSLLYLVSWTSICSSSIDQFIKKAKYRLWQCSHGTKWMNGYLKNHYKKTWPNFSQLLLPRSSKVNFKFEPSNQGILKGFF